ncbi:MAG TPA: SDR family NAD(P)-dependent oxidoreductase [Chlorobaculum sp.]|uniref:Oxidoreductase, short-chain dehydrogenase/reductase family n=1 Tax=Chlorobaculum tepidum (strain ATCC 49652 / DSM 12025 / NBRC 103806 / TLS) TaxID=194439 RepID=Q8KCV2_CHLTE|nr:SDR family oxidoreductase [Chlorobaculum tepidum]AAM72538.1 oxidoreductase, short-chain dehydrogenase/reductase family [Chlorobaculum tepidum TLS]HBU24604.1 SDR family NAD(P)-dependent oxidoreductase [Chlorobaculum sp.]
MTTSDNGKVLLITGASTGIGRSTAIQAVEAGWRVVVAARSAEKLAALAAELGAERAMAVPCDVADWNQQEAMVQKTIGRFGRLDAVFANAGFSKGSSFIEGEHRPDEWRDMVMTNVFGAAATARLTLPELMKTKGHFLVTGSVLGRVTSMRNLYAATKWAVTGMAQAIRNEVASLGVRVTLVEPGIVDTPFWEGLQKPAAPELLPEDVARAVLFALGQPPHVDVSEIIIRPTGQAH